MIKYYDFWTPDAPPQLPGVNNEKVTPTVADNAFAIIDYMRQLPGGMRSNHFKIYGAYHWGIQNGAIIRRWPDHTELFLQGETATRGNHKHKKHTFLKISFDPACPYLLTYQWAPWATPLIIDPQRCGGRMPFPSVYQQLVDQSQPNQKWQRQYGDEMSNILRFGCPIYVVIPADHNRPNKLFTARFDARGKTYLTATLLELRVKPNPPQGKREGELQPLITPTSYSLIPPEVLADLVAKDLFADNGPSNKDLQNELDWNRRNPTPTGTL